MEQRTAIQVLKDCNSDEEAQKVFKEHPSSAQFVTIHNPQGAFINACPYYLAHTGYAIEDLIGESAYSFFHGDDLKEILKSHASITLRPEVSEVTYRLKAKNGSFILLRTYSKQLPTEDGSGTIVTITEPLEK